MRAVSAAASSVTMGSSPVPVRVIVGLLNIFPTVTPSRTLCRGDSCLHSAFGHPTGGRGTHDHPRAARATSAIEGDTLRKPLDGHGLREQVDGAPYWRVGRYLALPGRLDREVRHELTAEACRDRLRAAIGDLAGAPVHAQTGKRGDLVSEAARDHPIKAREIGRDIEREAMRRDTARNAYPDRGDLRGTSVAQVHPDPGLAGFAPTADAICGQRVGDAELERTNVGDEIASLAEKRDRIADDLAGAVK